jgi:DNA topoisomerase-1
VQSVATRLVVDRERARMAFTQAEYWDLVAELAAQGEQTGFETKLIELGGKRVAIGKDFAETTGELKKPDDVVLLSGESAGDLANKLKQAAFNVSDIQQKPFTTRPYAPFITSTLQQEAGRKLRYSAQRTMRLAQSLYENGYITYMRTDSTTLSSQALSAARKQATDLYGAQYIPDAPRTYKSKSKNAQEAHEAIRPAGEYFRTPQDVKGELNEDQFKLYDLIWKRTIASQMKDARGQRTSVRIDATGAGHDTATFTVSGKVIEFPGYMRAYVEGSDDPSAELENQEKVLPPLTVGQQLDAKRIEALQHFTQPPARYTEASLIRELEERGIGRPSTYASIIQTIQDRGYVWRKGTALVPTFTAFAVVNLLEQHMPDLVDYDFTARMEDGLDGIANGDQERKPWLSDFYYGGGNGNNGTRVREIGLKAVISSSGDEIDPRAISTIPIGKTEGGDEIVVRVGRYGSYVQSGDAELKANVPDDIPPDEITVAKALELLEEAAQGDKVLGNDPDTGKPVYLKSGRFGPYVQLGDPELTEKGNVKRGGKPKMASLWPNMAMPALTLEDALMLLSFPREVGKHPETGEVITAQDGRYGPYIKMGTDSRSLPNHESLRSVTLDEAVKIFKEPKRRGRGATSQQVIAELGEHPTSGGAMQVKNGRFGPYVTDGVVNATVPKGEDPAKVTAERAVELIKIREEKLRDQGKDPRAAKAKKATKKTAKKTKKSSKKKAAKKSTKKKVSKA